MRFFIRWKQVLLFFVLRMTKRRKAYDWYKRLHCWSISAYIDMLGRFIRIEITDVGAEVDRVMYTDYEVYKGGKSLSMMGNKVLPTWAIPVTETLSFHLKELLVRRGCTERSLTATRASNSWYMSGGFGYLTNRHSILLGCWPFEEKCFEMAYPLCAFLDNWRFCRRGYALRTICWVTQQKQWE